MQDYNYIFSNCMEVTAELSCSKRPAPEKLSTEWENNLSPMLVFLGSVDGGVKGLVRDEEGNVIEGASVEVRGREKVVRSSQRGEYWRLLLPGQYQITASHANKFGVLEADIQHLEIVNLPGAGAVRRDLVLKHKLYQNFTVTTIKTGGELYYQEEVKSLFRKCDVIETKTTCKQYVKLQEVIMSITVLLDKQSLEDYCFQHFYNNTIRRFDGIHNIYFVNNALMYLDRSHKQKTSHSETN